jgi:hypothetical protein
LAASILISRNKDGGYMMKGWRNSAWFSFSKSLNSFKNTAT